jgi:hypothetical protein
MISKESRVIKVVVSRELKSSLEAKAKKQGLSMSKLCNEILKKGEGK